MILPQGFITSAGHHVRLDFAPVGGKDEPCLPGEMRGIRLVSVVQLTASQERSERDPAKPPPLLAEPRVLVTYDYNEEGDLVLVKNAMDQVTHQFAWANHIMIAHTDAAGLVSHYDWTKTSPEGKVLRNRLSDGRQWLLEYFAGYTKVTFITPDDPKGSTKIWLHDEGKNYIGHTNELGGKVQRKLDAFGNLMDVTDEAGRTVRFTLNVNGRPTAITGPNGVTVRIAYHPEIGKISAITAPNGATTKFLYDKRGNQIAIIDAKGHTTLFQNDINGQPITITDPEGRTKHITYNACAQVTSYTDCSGHKSTVSYDEYDHLAMITNAKGQKTLYFHDILGNLLSVTYPDGSQEHYTYDGASRLVTYTDQKGNKTEYTLDTDGQPITRTDAQGGVVRYVYDGARRIKSLINENNARYDFGHDALNRLIWETGFDARHTQYRYDPTGLILSKLEVGTLTAEQRREQQARMGDPQAPQQFTKPTVDNPWGVLLPDVDAP